MTELDVPGGTSYTVNSQTTEEWSSADVDGTLEVQGTLLLGEDDGAFTTPTDGFNLPMEIEFRSMNMGLAVFIVGMLVFLGGASAILRNFAAMGTLGLAVVALLMSGTLGVSLGYFWATIIGTVLVLIAGAMGRVLVS